MSDWRNRLRVDFNDPDWSLIRVGESVRLVDADGDECDGIVTKVEPSEGGVLIGVEPDYSTWQDGEQFVGHPDFPQYAHTKGTRPARLYLNRGKAS